MIRADVLYLIAKNPEAHGVFDEVQQIERMVYCTVRSVGMNEIYAAKSEGITPEYVFELSDLAEYNGEKLCQYNGVMYHIIRTYVDWQKIEITVERVNPNA